VDDHQIKEINKKYLHRNRPTDVISFSQIEGEGTPENAHLLGDVVVSLETAQRQAQDSHTSLQDEVTFLLVHGVLHLLGYDHEGSVSKAREMEEKQRDLLSHIKSCFRT
jgi:probable rRNA maturation factor